MKAAFASSLAYRPQAAQAELATLFPGARDVAIEPMSLRAIFLAVAKAGRTPASSVPVPASATETMA